MGKFRPAWFLAGITALVAMGIAATATAVTVSCGPQVCYQYDETQSALAFYGAPSVVGNDLVFTPGLPNPFRAQSQDGAGVPGPGVVVTGGGTATNAKTLVIDRVWTLNPANEIAAITAIEQGDYEIVQGGSISGDLFLQAVSLVSVLDNATATDAVNATGDSGGLQLWQMNAAVNPLASFVQAANNLKLTVQNTLSAFTSANGDNAFIEKKLVLTVSTVVPLPAALWLLGSALGLLGCVRRRRA